MALFKQSPKKLGSSADDKDALYYKTVDGSLALTTEFEEDVVDIFEKSLDPASIDGDLLDIDKGLSPTSNLPAICMDLMMYDSPELFER